MLFSGTWRWTEKKENFCISFKLGMGRGQKNARLAPSGLAGSHSKIKVGWKETTMFADLIWRKHKESINLLGNLIEKRKNCLDWNTKLHSLKPGESYELRKLAIFSTQIERYTVRFREGNIFSSPRRQESLESGGKQWQTVFCCFKINRIKKPKVI